MVRKITDKKILKLFNNLDNEAIKKVLLKEDNDFFAMHSSNAQSIGLRL